MVKVKCPRTDCDFETEDTDIVLAAALLNAHTTEHQLRGGQGNTISCICLPNIGKKNSYLGRQIGSRESNIRLNFLVFNSIIF